MGRRSALITSVTLYTLTVVGVTVVLERRDRLACSPGDDSCDGINSVNRLVYEAAGAFSWLVGMLLIVFLARSLQKRATRTSS